MSDRTDAPDVLVVGGGFAGCIAALTAARERPSAAVEMLVTADDRFDGHSGTIDVLGYPSAGSNNASPVARPLEALDSLPAEHPCRRLGRDRLERALALFDAELDYRGETTGQNALVPTHVGRVRPTARYPAGMAAGLASRKEPMRLVGFEQSPSLDAALVADRLETRLPYAVTAATVEFPGRVTQYPSGPVLARALDEDDPPSGDIGTPAFGLEDREMSLDELPTGAMPPGLGDDETSGSAREQLRERVLPELDVEGRVGFPAVLGETEHVTVRQTLETAFHADVFEVPVGPPSVPGRRLEGQLHAALSRAGVAVTGGTVDGFEADSGLIERVSLPDGDRTVGSVILATGGLSGPGLVASGSAVREPVFDCYVDYPDDRSAWTEPGLLDDHAFARFGLPVDEKLRPLDAGGHPEYDNLRVAGRLVGGFNYDAEQSADGVGLVTGHAAGRWSLP